MSCIDRDNYKHYNLRGDVIVTTDSAGSVLSQSQYEAYGEHTDFGEMPTDKHRANTKVEDTETNLLLEGHRYRHLEYKTFMSPDPLEYVDGLNFYAYCGFNPWGRFDPDGLKVYATTAPGTGNTIDYQRGVETYTAFKLFRTPNKGEATVKKAYVIARIVNGIRNDKNIAGRSSVVVASDNIKINENKVLTAYLRAYESCRLNNVNGGQPIDNTANESVQKTTVEFAFVEGNIDMSKFNGPKTAKDYKGVDEMNNDSTPREHDDLSFYAKDGMMYYNGKDADSFFYSVVNSKNTLDKGTISYINNMEHSSGEKAENVSYPRNTLRASGVSGPIYKATNEEKRPGIDYETKEED